eukprot:NODE_639_length_2024_cov_34.337722_g590_i0.p2 GENE.NODE_639_length_2024_cov_34.337722_g590_i0~~NODE_639_length_2024_cov_34.337722_g590_i0.p2  ORF type:complete len:255 (+),score=58.55 NODE_639_length_2024_cov_34.337722_g590_i0:63-827(+)
MSEEEVFVSVDRDDAMESANNGDNGPSVHTQPAPPVATDKPQAADPELEPASNDASTTEPIPTIEPVAEPAAPAEPAESAEPAEPAEPAAPAAPTTSAAPAASAETAEPAEPSVGAEDDPVTADGAVAAKDGKDTNNVAKRDHEPLCLQPALPDFDESGAETEARLAEVKWEWSQTESDVEIRIELPENSPARALKVVLGANTIRVLVNGEPLVDWTLHAEVNPNAGEPQWTIETNKDGRRILLVELPKKEAGG